MRGRNQNFEKVTYVFRLFDFWKVFFFAFPCSLFLLFLLQWLTFYWACLRLKNFSESIIETQLNQQQQPGVVAGNFGLNFSLIFLRILCISQASFARSLWSGHYWKDLFLLHKLSMDDVNFGQKWWRQKWKTDQGSSRPVTGGTGVNRLRINPLTKNFRMRLGLLSVFLLFFFFFGESIFPWKRYTEMIKICNSHCLPADILTRNCGSMCNFLWFIISQCWYAPCDWSI